MCRKFSLLKKWLKSPMPSQVSLCRPSRTEMAPIYKRKTSLGGVSVEPVQPYVAPTRPSVVLTEVEVANIVANLEPPPLPPKLERPKPLLCYRDVLGLSQQNVADIFNKVVTGTMKRLIPGDPS